MRTAYEKRQTSIAASLKLLTGICVFGLSTPALAEAPNLASVAVTASLPVMAAQMPTLPPTIANNPLPPNGVATNSPATQISGAAADMKLPPVTAQVAAHPVSDNQPLHDGIIISAPPPAPLYAQPSGDHKEGKSLKEVENKASDAAKEVIRNFSSTSEGATLDDLNSAKMAVAKIDALIELEKHLAELEKIRNEREGHSTTIAAIPASALAPPPMPVSKPAITEEKPAPRKVAATLEVQQISGSVGNISAQLLVNGQSKTVRVGDELPDGSLVTDITANGVTIRRDGVLHRLQMKSVDFVYGRTY
jgi:type IV pilus biogenesis protein PilP